MEAQGNLEYGISILKNKFAQDILVFYKQNGCSHSKQLGKPLIRAIRIAWPNLGNAIRQKVCLEKVGLKSRKKHIQGFLGGAWTKRKFMKPK